MFSLLLFALASLNIEIKDFRTARMTFSNSISGREEFIHSTVKKTFTEKIDSTYMYKVVENGEKGDFTLYLYILNLNWFLNLNFFSSGPENFKIKFLYILKDNAKNETVSIDTLIYTAHLKNENDFDETEKAIKFSAEKLIKKIKFKKYNKKLLNVELKLTLKELKERQERIRRLKTIYDISGITILPSSILMWAAQPPYPFFATLPAFTASSLDLDLGYGILTLFYFGFSPIYRSSLFSTAYKDEVTFGDMFIGVPFTVIVSLGGGLLTGLMGASIKFENKDTIPPFSRSGRTDYFLGIKYIENENSMIYTSSSYLYFPNFKQNIFRLVMQSEGVSTKGKYYSNAAPGIAIGIIHYLFFEGEFLLEGFYNVGYIGKNRPEKIITFLSFKTGYKITFHKNTFHLSFLIKRDLFMPDEFSYLKGTSLSLGIGLQI